MIEPGLIKLMNLAIDGVATPRERADLESALAANPEARSYYDSLSRMVERLNADPMPEPPVELEPRILDAVHHASVHRPAPVTASRRGFFSPGLRPWSTFGLGLAAGVLIVAVIDNGHLGNWNASRQVNPGTVSGSMVTSDGPQKTIGIIPVEAKDGTTSGEASIYQEGSAMVVHVQLQSTVPVEWRVEFDPDAWTLARVERVGTATSAFTADRTSVQGSHTGEGGVNLVFAGSKFGAQAVVFKLLQDGQPVFEGRLSAAN